MENNSKPLSEWTLGEAQEECIKHESCREDCDCPFRAEDSCILQDGPPCEWDLTDKPHFTEDEVEQARAAEILFGENAWVERNDRETLWLRMAGMTFPLPNGLFPSIRPDQSVSLESIIDTSD